MIECHCGKCNRLATKNTKLKERVAELEATILELCEHFDLDVEDFTPRHSLENMLQQLTQEMQKNGEYKEKHIPPATMADAVKAQEDTTAPEWIAQRSEVTASEDGEVKR